MTDTTIEPRQPSRLEKKANTQLYRIRPDQQPPATAA